MDYMVKVSKVIISEVSKDIQVIKESPKFSLGEEKKKKKKFLFCF